MAAEEASGDRMENQSLPTSALGDDKLGALGVYREASGAVEEAQRSIETAGEVLTTDQEACYNPEEQHSAGDASVDSRACSTSSRESSEGGETTKSSHQPQQRQSSDIQNAQVFEEAATSATDSIRRLSGVSASDDSAGQRSDDGGGTASCNMPSSSDGSPRKFASDSDLAVAPRATISSTESTPGDGQLTHLHLGDDRQEDSSEEAEHSATSGEDNPERLASEESSPRESCGDDSTETALLGTEGEGSDLPAGGGAGSFESGDRVGGVDEGEDATVLQDNADDSARVPEDHTRSVDDGTGPDPHQPLAGHDLPQQTVHDRGGSPAATSMGGDEDSFAGDSDLGRVSFIAADARKLVGEVIASSLVAIVAAGAAMARDVSSKPERVAGTNQPQCLPTSPDDSPSLGQVGCRKESKRRSSRVDCGQEALAEAQREVHVSASHSSAYASVRTDVAEEFISRVFEVVSAMAAATAAANAAKAVKVATSGIAERPQTVDTVAETRPETPLGADNESVDIPLQLDSPGHTAVSVPSETSLVDEAPASLLEEASARLTTDAAETNRRLVVEAKRPETTTGKSHTMTSPSGALPRPLSASVRNAVVADYLSEAHPATLAAALDPSTHSAHPEESLPAEGFASENSDVSASALVSDCTPEHKSQSQAEATPPLPNEPAREEESETRGAEPPTYDTASATTPRGLSAASLRSAVVEDFMSQRLPGVVTAASLGAAASPSTSKPSDAESDVQSTDTRRGTFSADGDDRSTTADDTSVSSTPPSTPGRQSLGNAGAVVRPEVTCTPNAVPSCEPPVSPSAEAATFLMEMGDRAKRMQESSEKTRTDASAWLRDRGSKALSPQGGEKAARKASAVVEEYLLGVLREVVASEAGASGTDGTASCSLTTSAPGDATTRVPSDQFAHDVSAPRDQGATADEHRPLVDEEDDVGSTGEESAPTLASHSSDDVDTVSLVSQKSEDQEKSPLTASRDDRGGGLTDGFGASPTQGRPSENRFDDIRIEVQPEEPFDHDHIAVCGAPSPQSVEALAYLIEVGTRARYLQESSEKSRTDASSWLREAGSRALSSHGVEQAARKATAVVEEYLSDALRGVLTSETAAGAAAVASSPPPATCIDDDAARIAERDQAAPGVPLPHDPLHSAVTETASATGGIKTAELSVPMLAVGSSVFETAEVVGQEPADQGETSPTEQRDADRGSSGELGCDPPGSSPSPRSSNAGRQNSSADRELDPEAFVRSDTVVNGGQSRSSRSIEALAYLAGVGLRAKSLQEAADWLWLAGRRATSAEERADRGRGDASSWLRDAGVKALSVTDQEQAAEGLLLAAGRAKSAQDRVDRARTDASSWLREKGGRALSLCGREQARRAECAAWLSLTGGRAKSAQGRSDKAREDASSWLRNTGVGAVSLQNRAEGARSDAATWLKSKATSELERTESAKGLAEPVVAAAATPKQGEPDAENAGRSSQGVSPSGLSITAGGSPRAGFHPNTVTAEIAGSGSVDKGSDQDAPSGDKEAVRALEHPADDSGSKNIELAVANDTSTPAPPRHTTDSAEGGTSATASAADAAINDLEQQPPGRTASTDRTAPAPWLEPATTPLASTAAGTEDFGRMLGAGENEWARVSLSRTPPFDALNSPSLPVRYAPVRGRPRPLPPDAEIFETGGPSGGAPVADAVEPAGEAVHPRGAGAGGAGAVGNADGPGWMEFFAPPDRMAPRGDAYRGSDGFRSAEASASTTVRADSSSADSFASGVVAGPSQQRERDGGDDGRRQRADGDHDGNDYGWGCSGHGGGGGRGGDGVGVSPEEGWGERLGEVLHPAGEAQDRLMERIAVAGGGRWEGTESFPSTSREIRESGRGARGGKRWHKKAEQSRQYMRRWEAFLGRAHRHFDGEADVRKRMSLVRRAHPDVSNEVAYVALAQSRGRSSEAAAVLHLPRAKDEAAMVTMMLDITTFISLARQAAETRRRSRQLEKQRRMVAAAGRGAAGSPFRRKGRGDGEPPPQSPPSPRQRLEKERWRSGGGWEGDATDADRCVGLAATARSGNGRQRVRPGKQRRNVSAELLPKEPRYRNTNGSISGSTSSENGGSRGKLQSRRSDSAPSLLPPIEGSLTEGTPPSPGTLKAVLSTSRSVAVKVPRGLGFAAVEAGAPNNDEKFAQDGGCGPTRATRRDLKAMLWARARWQRQRMAEMAAAGKPHPHQQQKKQGGVETLDAIMERFLCEMRTLDRDSEYLNARLQGRQEKQGCRGGKGLHRSAARGVGRRAGVGTASTGSSGRGGSTVHSPGRRGVGGVDGCQRSTSQASSPIFLASVNSNATAPFMFMPEGVDDACSTSPPVATASAACPVVEAGSCSRDRGSCRVQSYFTQALGDESLCGSKKSHCT